MGKKNKKSNNRKAKRKSFARKQQTKREMRIGIWEELLESKVKNVDFPGGKDRDSRRLELLDGRSVIATERSDLKRAEMECAVLRQIGSQLQSVPNLIISDGYYRLAQEDLGGIRLSQALHNADEQGVESLLTNSLTQLSAIQKCGSEAGFDGDFLSIGHSPDWIKMLLSRPGVIGDYLKIPAPKLDLDDLLEHLKVRAPRFIKWDTRPGNANVQEQDQVVWFDWEHCGTRNRLDDAAWLLCDEFTPDYPETEARVIDLVIDQFADEFSDVEARIYLAVFGVFHSCVRLGFVLKYKKGGDWWDLDYCLKGDKVGITLESGKRICSRAERWAKQSGLTKVLAPWFREVAGALESL